MTNLRGIGRIKKNNPLTKKGKKYIFGIGITEYTNWSDLPNATNDLDDVVKILTDRYDFDFQDVYLLKNANATRKKIVNSLHEFTSQSKLGEDDSLLIYFSGHGFLDENKDGYWVPSESEKDDIDSFIPNSTIQAKIKSMKCRHVLLVSDSCFSGSLLAEGERMDSTESLVADELEMKKSRWIFSSGGRDEKVSDGFGKNSPFAEAIISELKYNTKPKFIIDNLAINVRNITRSNAIQMPQFEKMFQAGDLGGRFIFYLRQEGSYKDINTDFRYLDEILKLKKEMISRKMSERTIKTYTNGFSKFLHYYKNIHPKNITKEQITTYMLNRIEEDNISVSVQNNFINALKCYYEFVLGRERIHYNIQRPHRNEVPIPNLLSEEDVLRLFQAVDNIKHKCILLTIYSAGLRLSEVINLRKMDIKKDDNRICVKGNGDKKDRYTLLSSILIEELAIYQHHYKTAFWLFEGQTGGQYAERSVQVILEKAVKKSGVSPLTTVNVNTLRYSFAAHLVLAGYDLNSIQKLMGQQNDVIIKIYESLKKERVSLIQSPLDRLKLEAKIANI